MNNFYSIAQVSFKNSKTAIHCFTSPSLMHETGHSKLVHWDNSEGWDEEGGGRGGGMEHTCTPVADSCQCMAKTTTTLQSN